MTTSNIPAEYRMGTEQLLTNGGSNEYEIVQAIDGDWIKGLPEHPDAFVKLEQLVFSGFDVHAITWDRIDHPLGPLHTIINT